MITSSAPSDSNRSPLSSSKLFGQKIVDYAERLGPSVHEVLPLWLSDLIALKSQLSMKLYETFATIERSESHRLRRASPSTRTFSTMASQRLDNLSKNRYADIVPFDRNRVVLSKNRYINASHIRGPYGMKNYIVTQGPLQKTVDDFWQMVWEQKSPVIVMLTLEEERARVKCHKYWPSSQDQPISCRGIQVSLIGTESILGDSCLVRTLSLAVQVPEKDPERRIVTQIQFLGWPDHHVSNPYTVLELIAHVNSLLRASMPRGPSEESLTEESIPGTSLQSIGPPVIHCSAGVGRTGTYCTIDAVIGLLEDGLGGSSIDIIQHTVHSLREQRVSMVQTLEQFAFCYEAVLYWIEDWVVRREMVPKWIAIAKSSSSSSENESDDDVSPKTKHAIFSSLTISPDQERVFDFPLVSDSPTLPEI